MASQLGSRGRRVSPCKVQGAGPPIVPGSNCSALVIVEARGEEEGERAGLKLCRAPASSSLIHPSTLETHCLTVRAWSTPNVLGCKQHRQNRNNNNSQTLLGGYEDANHKRTVEGYKGEIFYHSGYDSDCTLLKQENITGEGYKCSDV